MRGTSLHHDHSELVFNSYGETKRGYFLKGQIDLLYMVSVYLNSLADKEMWISMPSPIKIGTQFHSEEFCIFLISIYIWKKGRGTDQISISIYLYLYIYISTHFVTILLKCSIYIIHEMLMGMTISQGRCWVWEGMGEGGAFFLLLLMSWGEGVFSI